MSKSEHGDEGMKTYRGRTLEELIPQIRSELGDDAVIVGRREARSGGVGGFFAKREIEVDAMAAVADDAAPEQDRPQADPTEAFREQLERAQGRRGGLDLVSDEPAAPAHEPTEPVEPAQSMQPQGWSAAGEADVVPISAEQAGSQPPHGEGTDGYESELDAVLDEELDFDDGPPTEIFDSLAAAIGAQPGETALDGNSSEDEALAAEPRLPEPEPPTADVIPISSQVPLPSPPPPSSSSSTEQSDQGGGAELESGPIAIPAPVLAPTLWATQLSADADRALIEQLAGQAVERIVARGLDAELAELAVAEAIAALLPFDPDADIRALIARALARRLPIAPLRSGAAVVAFVGSGGADATRSVARLAAAYQRGGLMKVTAIALRTADGGDELRRLLSPYMVNVTYAEDVERARTLVGELKGDGLVIIDTPAIGARRPEDVKALAAELEQIGVEEIHLALPATMGAQAAVELLDVCGSLPLIGLTITHIDETLQIGSALGLAIERKLPISYVGRGQAVDTGLSPAAAEDLAAELLS